MLCKTIILSNSENLASNAPKGILTLSKENNTITGKIRLYNLSSLPQSTKVGLYINEKVHISSLSYKQQCYTFNLENNIDISQSIYCALIDTANNKKVLLEGGSFNGFCFTDSPFDAVLESKDEQLEQDINNALKDIPCNDCNCANCEYKKHFYENYSKESPQNVEQIQEIVEPLKKDDCETHFNPPIQSKIPENTFDDTIQSNIVDKLKKDIVKDFEDYWNQFEKNSNNTSKNKFVENDYNNMPKNEFFENNYNNTSKNKFVENDYNNTSKNEFVENDYNNTSKNEFVENKTIVDDLSKNSNISENKDNKDSETNQNQQQSDFLNDIIYQLDELLTKNPPDDTLNSIIPNSRFVKVESESPYVLGVIYEDKMLKYIAYGVPANYNELPPKDLGQHYQWLPLNPRDVMSDGYFMIFQDALTGTLVEINFEE